MAQSRPRADLSGEQFDVSRLSEARRHWDAIAVAWAATGRDALWRTHSDAVNRGLVAAWMTECTGTLLKTDAFDEACSGGLAQLLESRAARVIYIDLSLWILASARTSTVMRRAVCCDVRHLPFAADSIGAVVSNSTLDHFPDARQIDVSLRELARVLRPGGQLLLTLDNPVNPLVALRRALPLRLLRAVRLVPYFVGATLSPSQLGRSCAAAGFTVRRMGAILHCPRVVAVVVSRVVQRWAPPWGRRLLAVLGCFEGLQRWPTRYLTGNYVTVSALRSPPAAPSIHEPASDTRSSS